MVDTKKAKRVERHKVGGFVANNTFWCERCCRKFTIPRGDMHEPAARFLELLKLRHNVNSPHCTAPKVHFVDMHGDISLVYFTFKGVK